MNVALISRVCILAGPVSSILFEQGAWYGFDHELQAFHRAALATLGCYAVLLVVSLATRHERDHEREQYTFKRFKAQRQIDAGFRRVWWQNDKLWAGLLVVCTLGMCWFFR